MELEDIFTLEERKLYPQVAALQTRYLQLRQRFEQFVNSFPPENGHFPEGIAFVPEADKPMLTVKFGGKELRFDFEMVQEQGQVSCLVSSSNKVENEYAELGRFTFNGQGITNINPPVPRDAGPGNPLPIHESRAAYGIVAAFLVAAFQPPPGGA